MSEIYKEKPLIKVVMLKGKDGTGSKLSELDNDMTFLTQEQIVTLVRNIITTGEIGDIDIGVVTTVTEQNWSRGLKFWVGTQAEYDQIIEHDNYTFYIITDETKIDAKALADLKAELEEEIRAAVEGVNYDDEIAALNEGLQQEAEERSFEDVMLQGDIDKINATLSESVYSVDEVDSLEYYGGGLLTNASKTVIFSMPLRKNLPSGLTAAFTHVDTIEDPVPITPFIKLHLRQDGNYIFDGQVAQNAGYDADLESVTITECGNFLNFKFKWYNALTTPSGATAKNNSEMTVECTCRFKVQTKA